MQVTTFRWSQSASTATNFRWGHKANNVAAPSQLLTTFTRHILMQATVTLALRTRGSALWEERENDRDAFSGIGYGRVHHHARSSGGLCRFGMAH